MEQHDMNDAGDEAKTIGENCRRFREARAWTQEHLAGAAGVDVRTIQRMEAGKRVGAESLLAVAAALSVDVGQLRQDEAKMKADLAEFHKRYALIPLKLVERASELTQHLPYDFLELDAAPLKNDEQEDARARFRGIFDDAAMVWTEMSAMDRRESEHELKDAIDELERTGLAVSVGTHELRLKSLDRPEMPRFGGTLLIIVLSDKTEPKRMALFDKKQQIRFGV